MGEPDPQPRWGRVDLGAERLDLAVRQLERLPTLEAVAARLAVLAGGRHAGAPPEDAAAEILALIASDPALTANLLRRAADDQAEVRTVAEAARRLGPEAVRSLVLSVPSAPAGAEGQVAAGGGLDYAGFWRHCVAVGCATEKLAPRAGVEIDPEAAYVCGLLHDLGKLALAEVFPKSYVRVLDAFRTHGGSVSDCERKILGADHCVMGRRLAEAWRLPAAVRDVCWLHHQALEAIPACLSDRRLVAVVDLADAIARRRRIGFSGNDAFSRSCEQQADELGLPASAVAEVAEELREVTDRRAATLHVAPPRAGGGADVRIGAGAELARINEALGRRARMLEGRAKAFADVGEFASSLAPGATVVDALEPIARLVAAGVESPGPRGSQARDEPVVAYAVGEGGGSLTAVCLRGGRCAWAELTPGPAAAREGACPPAGVAADTFIEYLADPAALGRWLDPSACAHRPLCCQGQWLGGVLFRQSSAGGGPPAGDESVLEALIAAAAPVLALVRRRGEAMALGEELAGASQVLAATQEAFAEARTLAAAGEMAAGAAHEINNPLAVISGRAQWMAERTDAEADRRTWRLIATQAEHITDIISDLMDFARPPDPRTSLLSPAKLLSEAAEIFRATDHPKAEAAGVDIETEENVSPVAADEAQIRAVIVELITNAANAGGEAPRVSLRAEADEVHEAVLFTVADDGCGMDAETLAGAFVPFFSSQQAGRRRGLGLPRAKRYVENNGGRIWIRSAEGEGAKVFFLLPGARGATTERHDARP